MTGILSNAFCVWKYLQKESQKADDYLREIKEQSLLSEAVRQCVEAAGHEHEAETQKTLLRVSHEAWMLQEEKPFIYRRNDNTHTFSLSLNCCLCRQPRLGSAFWVIFLRSSLSACAETCGCWMQSETIPSAFLLPTLSTNRWLYRCSSTGETIRESNSVQNNCLFALQIIVLWSLPFEMSEVVKWVRHLNSS